MEPYFTLALGEAKAKAFNAIQPPWAIIPEKPAEAEAPTVIHPGDVILVLPRRSARRPQRFPISLNTYIIHPASGRQGWFWSALLETPV